MKKLSTHITESLNEDESILKHTWYSLFEFESNEIEIGYDEDTGQLTVVCVGGEFNIMPVDLDDANKYTLSVSKQKSNKITDLKTLALKIFNKELIEG